MANEEARATWTDSGVGWVENEAVFDATFAPLTSALLEAAGIDAEHRVLDVGCGSGTLLAAAASLGAEAVGVDLSPTMVAAARARVPAATVLEADAQTADLAGLAPGRPFDRVVSRFGVMFFEDPVAAFARIRSVAAPGGRLAFVCWRSYDANPSFSLGQDVLAARMAARLGEQPAPAAADSPGPMAFADPSRIAAVLGDAGWGDVVADPLDVVLDYGFDGSDGVEHRLATVLSTSTGRRARAQLLPHLGEDGWTALLDEVRAHVAAARVTGVLRLPAATWLVTASA